MEKREIKFGSITIVTNGFDKEIYMPLFEDSNLPTESEHPENWGVEKFMEIFLELDADDGEPPCLGEQQIKFMQEAAKTRLTKEVIEERNQMAYWRQLEVDRLITYPQSEGFFKDFQNAFGYCNRLMVVGPGPFDSYIHSTLVINGRGEGALTSNAGIEYKLEPYISVDGRSHYRDFYMQIILPEGRDDEETKRNIVNYLVSREWRDGFSVVPETFLVEKDRSIIGHKLESKELGVYADLMLQLYRGIPIAGRVTNLEAFCKYFVNQLEPFFVS